MILLVVVASILITAVTIIVFNNQSRDYHEERLERKESHLIVNLNYFIEEAMIDSLINIPQDKINEIADIHEIPFEIYSLQGQLLKTSLDSKLAMNDIILSPEILLFLKQLILKNIYIDLCLIYRQCSYIFLL